MADSVKKVIELEIDVNSGEVKTLNKEVQKTGKAIKDAEKGTKSLAGGFKKVGTALKAAGIGLVLAALATLKELFSQNQTIVDGFRTGMNALTIAFNDFFKFISSNVGTVSGFFKDLFENPLDNIKKFGEFIQEYIVKQIKVSIEGFGLLGESISYLIEGEFSKALDAAGEGVLKLGEAALKLNPVTAVVTNATEAIIDNKDAILDYASGVFDSASALTQQAKAMEMSEIASRRLQLQYQKQAEELRQIRDDETRTIEERIKANEKLGELLIESAEAEKAEVQNRINFYEEQNKQLGVTQERLVQIESLKVEQLDIDERIAGFRSEQLVNENSLLREQRDAIKELNSISSDETQSRIIELEQLYDERKRLAELNVSDEVERKRYLEEIESSHKAEIAKIEEEARLKKKEADAKALQEELAQKQALRDAEIKLGSDTFSALLELNNAFAGETEEAQRRAFQIDKALRIGQTIMNTAQAVSSALAQTTDPTPTQSLRFANAAIAGLMGAAQVAAIARTQFNAGGEGSPSAISAPTTTPQAPQFNTVGTSGFNQLSESIASQNKQPVQAYVVANDVSSAQSLERNKVEQASFP
jgi:hypothetical protein